PRMVLPECSVRGTPTFEWWVIAAIHPSSTTTVSQPGCPNTSAAAMAWRVIRDGQGDGPRRWSAGPRGSAHSRRPAWSGRERTVRLGGRSPSLRPLSPEERRRQHPTDRGSTPSVPRTVHTPPTPEQGTPSRSGEPPQPLEERRRP